MKNESVVLHVHEDKLNEQLSKIKGGVYFLQAIYEGLVGLGADAAQITIGDLKSLMISDGSPADIKKIVLRGKVLQVAGMMIARESIAFNEKSLRNLSLICRQAPSYLEREQDEFYEIVDSKVQVRDTVEDELRPRYTLCGSQRQKDIADKLAVIAEQINALRTEIGQDHPFAPMRDPSAWFTWNTRGEYVVDVFRIAKHI